MGVSNDMSLLFAANGASFGNWDKINLRYYR